MTTRMTLALIALILSGCEAEISTDSRINHGYDVTCWLPDNSFVEYRNVRGDNSNGATRVITGGEVIAKFSASVPCKVIRRPL